MSLDKEDVGVASRAAGQHGGDIPEKRGGYLQQKTAPVSITEQEDGITAYLHGDYPAVPWLFQPLAEHGDASAPSRRHVQAGARRAHDRESDHGRAAHRAKSAMLRRCSRLPRRGQSLVMRLPLASAPARPSRDFARTRCLVGGVQRLLAGRP
jgi:hypothetical protein